MGGGRHRNTTGSLASRVERPACGTLDAFVDVIAFPTDLGKLDFQKSREVVRFEIARQAALFPQPSRPTSRFLLVDLGEP
jgi:hypothetical protein